MDLELTDKVAVVTGASKGIGLAVTRALVDEGAHVIAGARSTDSLEGIEGVTAVPVDLAAADGPALLVQQALEQHGRVDVLVNNVGGVRLRTEGFLGTSDDEFQWAMDMNFFAALRATRAAIVPMLEQGAGRSSTSPRSTPSSNRTPARSTTAPRRPRSSTSPRRSPRSSGRAASASTRSPPARSAPTCGSVSTAWRRRWRRPPASTPTRPARRSSRHRRLRDRALHDARGGGHARRHARLGAPRQRHRLELRDRRRTDQDDLSGDYSGIVLYR